MIYAALFVMNLTSCFGCFQIMQLPVRFVLKAVLTFVIAFVHLSLTMVFVWSLHNPLGYLVGGIAVASWVFLARLQAAGVSKRTKDL